MRVGKTRCVYSRITKTARSRGASSGVVEGDVLTFQTHPDAEALLKATEGASFPLGLVYFTLLVLCASVPLVVLHGSLEEALEWKKRGCC